MKVKHKVWAQCICGCAPEAHQAVVLKPICVEQQGKHVLFEGTLGGCGGCGCDLYVLRTPPAPADTTGETETP